MTLVQSIMQRDLVSVDSSENVATVLSRLASKNVGAVLVLTEGRVFGILSERDVLRRVIARGRDPERTSAGEVATPEPKTVSERASVKECTELIRSLGFRHLPIVDAERRPVGMISSRDLLQFVVEGLEAYIDRHQAEQHREEQLDPYDTFSSSFEEPAH